MDVTGSGKHSSLLLYELILTLAYYLGARLEPTLRTYLTNVDVTGSGKHSSLLRQGIDNNSCILFVSEAGAYPLHIFDKCRCDW